MNWTFTKNGRAPCVLAGAWSVFDRMPGTEVSPGFFGLPQTWDEPMLMTEVTMLDGPGGATVNRTRVHFAPFRVLHRALWLLQSCFWHSGEQ